MLQHRERHQKDANYLRRHLQSVAVKPHSMSAFAMGLIEHARCVVCHNAQSAVRATADQNGETNIVIVGQE